MWMDEWYCSENGFAGYKCTSFMPKWQKTGIYQPGYPRFGIQESEEGEFTFGFALVGGETIPFPKGS